MQFGDVVLNLKQESGAVIAASYWPGTPMMLVGAMLAALGLLGVLRWPTQQVLVVRHDEVWVEFYATGRGVRDTVRALAEAIDKLAVPPNTNDRIDHIDPVAKDN